MFQWRLAAHWAANGIDGPGALNCKTAVNEKTDFLSHLRLYSVFEASVDTRVAIYAIHYRRTAVIFAVTQRLLYPDLDQRLLFILLTIMTLAAAIIGTYLTKPTDFKTLENFFRKTRPFGLWKPLRQKLQADAREAMIREHRNDIIAVPFVMVWQITLFIMPMELIVGNFKAFWITLPIFLFCLLGMYIFWYRNLPPAEESTADPTNAP